ncbi:DUF2252 family protein [Pseudoduganella sp. UC29_106]|uniref:DUF2252 family protein n=1 Tax=Pseudoduganella sp. UC29_106 TaxID=3374553 RepID=UPI0037581E2E
MHFSGGATAKKTARLRERDVVSLVTAFNVDREAEQVTHKYRLISANPFAFLRGTCHPYYPDYPADARFNQAPLAWICGDVHLENFGAYRVRKSPVLL